MNNFLSNKNINSPQYQDSYELNNLSEEIQVSPHYNWFNISLKRAIDLVGCFIFMAFIGFWLFPIIAILIKLESPGPVFFRQERNGIFNSKFKCYKFRSMVVNKEADLKQATKDDPRITRLGKILRKTSIDELPQILNVIYGNMSLVGPRPQRIILNKKSAKEIPGFYNRHLVKPGITGLAQAKGYRGETQISNTMYFRYKLDMYYIKTWNPLLDLKIIWMTFVSILTDNENAH
ncbi:sugar transferase [Algoriphagus machipongonensis]|uniref:Capsular polysaccharide biosynthesis protein n=1 Tax=Algoriphagus machipongonensis TaxID=388413 RepID=A3HRS2_9BACT|nr:sugar transferase [Algoriphagus machipongonensis]EAZ82540.1 capsular polysaccharide biosynthesis protein [Algoriphagus machipongonensis]